MSKIGQVTSSDVLYLTVEVLYVYVGSKATSDNYMILELHCLEGRKS